MSSESKHSKPTASRNSARRPSVLKLSGCIVLCAVGAAVYWSGWLSSSSPIPSTPLEPPQKTTGVLPASLGESWNAMDDPRKDGWDIETFNQQATETLKQFRGILEKPAEIGAQRISALVTKTFECTALLPDSRKVVFDDGEFSIERATLAAEPTSDESSSHQGVVGLVAALNTLMEPLGDAENIHCKFKLFRATRGETHVTTEQYLAVSGRTPLGVLEQNATWRMRWQYSDNQAPKIESIAVVDFEQVIRKNPDGALYADCTQSILDGNPCYESQFLRGRNHWLNQSQDTRYTYLLGNPGLAVGDVNGDGLDDLYACQEEGLPNRLFLQQADGTAQDVSESWGVNWLHNSRSALIVDLDNDGDQDLIVAMVGGVVVASNDGQKFTVRSILATDEDLMSLCAADYDQDADLDVYVCAYNGNEGLSATTRGGLIGGAITSNSFEQPNGGQNTLFRNDISDEKWQFTDVTRETQLDKELRPLSLAAAWDDFDNDGDPDLYVANDYGNNQLFRNDEGVFVEATRTTRAADRGFGMSVTWGDYDRDGWMDVYVSNMFSAAGNRITFQPQFLKDSPVMKQQLQRFARGNTLLKNSGPEHGFSDVSQAAAVTVGRWAWSSNFVDINNDGWEDLVVANGYVTTDDTGDL